MAAVVRLLITSSAVLAAPSWMLGLLGADEPWEAGMMKFVGIFLAVLVLVVFVRKRYAEDDPGRVRGARFTIGVAILYAASGHPLVAVILLVSVVYIMLRHSVRDTPHDA